MTRSYLYGEQTMAFEMIVGLTVSDDAGYQSYRDAMTPLLTAQGGGFRYDFVVSKALKSASPHVINRVFAIYFKHKASKDAFFSQPEYKAIRARHFEHAVTGRTVIAEYERA